MLLFSILLNFFWRIDEFGDEGRSGLPLNSFILIILGGTRTAFVIGLLGSRETAAHTKPDTTHTRRDIAGSVP